MLQIKKKRQLNFLINIIFLILFVVIGLKLTGSNSSKTVVVKTNKSKPPVTSIANNVAPVNNCANNQLANKIVVSISMRHLWACSQTQQVYDSPVVTGDENYVADATIPGTYKIYAKEVKVTLTGSDQSGSWNDPVNYWMPFLSNQYGTYGLHDAPWRTPDQFGNISPNSLNASHGCIELPTSTAAWLYNWAPIGTTVEINT